MSRLPIVPAGAVVVSPRCAALLAAPLRRLLEQARRDGYVDAEVAAVVEALDQVGRAWRAAARSENGTVAVPEPLGDDTVAAVELLSSVEVARRFGVSDRAVRARAARGTLPARRQGRAWVFDPAELAGVMEAS